VAEEILAAGLTAGVAHHREEVVEVRDLGDLLDQVGDHDSLFSRKDRRHGYGWLYIPLEHACPWHSSTLQPQSTPISPREASLTALQVEEVRAVAADPAGEVERQVRQCPCLQAHDYAEYFAASSSRATNL
jgi:hypothetical protein